MSEVQLIKLPGGMFRAANESDAEAVEHIANGSLVNAKIVQPRNSAFHRKFYAMLNFAFEYWEPVPIREYATPPEKNFDRFRKDVLIMAGYRTLVVNVKNEVRYEAESISFAKMDETVFHDVYRSVFGVCWQLVLSKVQGMTEAEAENAINQMIAFD